MNWVDLVIILVLILFTIQGFGKKFIYEFYDLIGFILAFILSFRFYNIPSSFLENTFSLPRSLAHITGFILIWYGAETIFFIICRALLVKISKKVNFPHEKFISLIPAFLRGIIFISITLMLVLILPIQIQVKKQIESSLIGSDILGKTSKLEYPIKNIFGGIVNDTFTFVTVNPKDKVVKNLGFKTDKYFFDQEMEFSMISLVNSERSKVGLKTLTFDPNLREVARGHSSDMLKRGYFSHYSPGGLNITDRMAALGINYLIVGENLAYAPSLLLAHQGLMQSPGHRANILSPEFHKIGIGIANAAELGVMFTQVFSN